ncbi:MAG: UPF0280 family protein [Burkholderiaceae bacterium]
MIGPQRAVLGERRWRFVHGPIDVVLQADGEPDACAAAFDDAWQVFGAILPALVRDLPLLRRPLPTALAAIRAAGAGRGATSAPLQTEATAATEETDAKAATEVTDATAAASSATGRAMIAACAPLAIRFGVYLTPMAAVAGAVADTLIRPFARPGITRAAANNGGDIALWLAPGACFEVGIVADVVSGTPAGRFAIAGDDPVRGIATSGWRGRSLSLGIADSATVLAIDGARADAAATLVANAVTLDADDRRVLRAPASSVRDDSDLGDLPVTVGVAGLDAQSIDRALASGLACARRLQEDSFIVAAAIALAGQWRILAPAGSDRALGVTRRARPMP